MEPVQFKGLIEFMDIFKTDDNCRKYLKNMLFPENPKCKCCNKRMYYCETQCYRGFKCYDCFTSQSLTQGTMFYNSRLEIRKWFIAIYMYSLDKQGLTSVKLAKIIGVQRKSAWHMLHRIRKTNHLHNVLELHKTVEADETYVGGKKKGKRGRGSKNKKIVFGMIQRKGAVYAKVVENCGAKSLHPIIRKKLRRKSTLVTDGWRAYRGLDQRYRFKGVSHKKQLEGGKYHTNTIESFWNSLKVTIRTYYGVSKKHLQKYVDEVVFKYNTRMLEAYQVFNMLIEKCLVTTSFRNLVDMPYILD